MCHILSIEKSQNLFPLKRQSEQSKGLGLYCTNKVSCHWKSN